MKTNDLAGGLTWGGKLGWVYLVWVLVMWGVFPGVGVCGHWCGNCFDRDAEYYWMCSDDHWPCGSETGCCPGPVDGLWRGTGNDNCSNCGNTGPQIAYGVGMPQWSVTEPRLNVWLADVPMYYQPSRGERMAFELQFKNELTQLDGEQAEFSDNAILHAGRNWYTPWCAYVLKLDGKYQLSNGRGSWLVVTNGGSPSYFGQLTCVTNAGGVPEVRYPSGVVDSFEQPDPFGGRYFRTSRRDANGNVTTYNYGTNENSTLCLTNIVDADGRSTTLTYTNVPTNQKVYCLLARVTDPFNRTVSLVYNTDETQLGCPVLTNIVDAAGMSSSFEYDGDFNLSRVATPYGTTEFRGYIDDEKQEGKPLGKALQVHEAGAVSGVRDHLYVLVDSGDVTKMAGSYVGFKPGTGVFPETFDSEDAHRRNTFYWNPVQFGRLDAGFVGYLNASNTLTVSNLTGINFLEARQRHWLLYTNDTLRKTTLGHTLSFERAPSPDGTTLGQITWYDYEDKFNGDPAYEGSSFLPRFIAWKLPDGQSRFTRYERNSLGHPTRTIETWENSSGSVLLRTNTYTYAANGIDLLSVSNALGVVSRSLYTTNGLVATNYNALNEATIYTYDTSNRVTSIHTPAGLTTTNLYGADGLLYRAIDLEINRTNTYTWSGGLVYSHTDERGLTVTNLYDGLNRLVKTTYPDGTFVTNTYHNLDLVRTLDRLGFTNRWEYNDFRQVVRKIDAQNRTNGFEYCECGSLEHATDPLGNLTVYTYDLAGRLVCTQYPDSYWVTNRFDLLGRITNILDSAGSSTTNWYNHQGLVAAVSNAFGRVSARAYDHLDRITNSVDASGVVVSMSHDALGRMRTRTYPDSGVERFGYGPAGLAAYTNQLNLVTSYTYDAAGRKVAEITSLTTNRFNYDASGSLTNLVDGKSQNTFWKYDSYGRVTNKVDHLGTNLFRYAYDSNGRMTNRTSAAKGVTGYRYDPVGNLTNIDYAASPDIALAYDSLNRVTNMISSGTFTNRFGYTVAGLLAWEDGPWDSDTVNLSYANRLRTGLSIDSARAAFDEAYSYDLAKRLTGVSSSAGTFSYSYAAGPQVRKIMLPGGSYITNIFDSSSRVLSTALRNSGGTLLDSHDYGYNVGNQRTQQVFTAGNYVNYTYDEIGELRTALGTEPSGTTNRLHEQLGYAYDPAGNLAYRTNNALVQTFGVNVLNALTMINRSGTLTVAGTTTSAATNVTVSGTGLSSGAAARYSDNTWARAGATPANGNNTYSATARDSYGRVDTSSSTVYLPVTNSFAYDLNGNMLSDGKRGLAYDDENQLIRVTVTNAWKSEFVYDGKMRRRVRKEFTWLSGGWSQTNEVRYVYDGNLVVQERWFDPQFSTTVPQQVVSYTRGHDLSGSREGAGGIGGLLARSSSADLLSPNAYYHADGNGNITALLNANQVLVAKYLYDPYGNILSQSGPLADANLYRFSSKELHPNSGLVYYLYRYYEPSLQRWVNRDPIEELGTTITFAQWKGKVRGRGLMEVKDGANLFVLLRNDPTDKVDPLGLYDYSDDDNYVDINGKTYNKGCLANARANSTACLKEVGKHATIGAAICVVGCLPTLIWSPKAYEICVIACMGLDAAITLYDLSGCLDEFNKAQKACEVCQPERGSGNKKK